MHSLSNETTPGQYGVGGCFLRPGEIIVTFVILKARRYVQIIFTTVLVEFRVVHLTVILLICGDWRSLGGKI
jgi:hypothetical protein